MSTINKTSLSNLENYLLSGTAAVISKTASAPIERVKLLIQNQNELIKFKKLPSPYSSASDCVKKVFINEGILAFWRGNFANCLRYFNYQAINFTLKEQIKITCNKYDISIINNNILLTNIIIGGMAGLCSGSILYSLDYTRTRLANDILFSYKQRQFKGIIDVYKQTLKSDGIIGLYRGFWITCITIVSYRGLYFGCYDSMKTIYPNIMGETQWFNKFIGGFLVSSSASVIVYPLDTVRRRMMMTSIGNIKYKGSIDCIKYIIKYEGFKSFYKGCVVNIIRGFAGAGTLVGFDFFQSLYTKFRS